MASWLRRHPAPVEGEMMGRVALVAVAAGWAMTSHALRRLWFKDDSNTTTISTLCALALLMGSTCVSRINPRWPR